MAGTCFNQWPVPLLQVSQMAKTTQAEHDQIFKDDDVAEDEGGADGSGEAILTELGDKLVPFPHEYPTKLWQEFIHVWDSDVGVLFQPGSGLALLAFVIERKRAVGLMKNKAHKDFAMSTLKNAVKTLGLAPDTRPPKPAALTAWESSRSLPAKQATVPKPPAPPAGLGFGPSVAMPPAPAEPLPSSIPMPPAPPAGAGSGPELAAFGSAPLR